ncbi:hypothetical protein PP359_07290 [Sphingomonas sp. BLCC-B65]|nr:hypothetical protein [Sphingomonas sp. BLCC-B65]
MALKTSLAGRVRNTTLPKTHALLPLHEAVVNGIQAIDARFPNDVAGRGRLTVRILREAQAELDLDAGAPGRAPLKVITGFSVEDNGIGFTSDNMTSFETLDSDFKASIGCRGVGRLLWLVAFDNVQVSSAYYDGESLSGRQFRFSISQDVVQEAVPGGLSDAGTIVHLHGFKKPFQQSAAKTAEAIAREIFEHCIWYFLRDGGAPDVFVSDDDETLSLKDYVEELGHTETTASFEVKGQAFEMLNLRLKTSARNATPRLHWCAANRVVKGESIAGKLPGLYARMKEDNSAEFTYVCYLSAPFLDDHVRADRTDFDLPERLPGDALIDEPTLDDNPWRCPDGGFEVAGRATGLGAGREQRADQPICAHEGAEVPSTHEANRVCGDRRGPVDTGRRARAGAAQTRPEDRDRAAGRGSCRLRGIERHEA